MGDGGDVSVVVISLVLWSHNGPLQMYVDVCPDLLTASKLVIHSWIQSPVYWGSKRTRVAGNQGHSARLSLVDEWTR